MKKSQHRFTVIEGGGQGQLGEKFSRPVSLGRPIPVDGLYGSPPQLDGLFNNEYAIQKIREEFDNAWGKEYKCMVVLMSEKTDNLRFLNYRKNDNPIVRVTAFREMAAFYNGDNDPEWTILMAVDTDQLLESQVPKKILDGTLPLKALKITPIINHTVYNPSRISVEDLTP